MRRTVLFSVLGLATAGVAAASVAVAPLAMADERAPTDSVKSSRATVRDAPARLVMANALPGDKITLQAHCSGWVRVKVTPAGHSMSTPIGWTARGSLKKASQSGGLKGVPKDCDQAREDEKRWRSYIAAMNSPFMSYYKNAEANPQRPWRRVFFTTPVSLQQSADCVPSANYIRDSGGERVDPSRKFEGLDMSKVGYRYVTKSGAVALVSAPRPGQRAGVWGFVPSSCLVPKKRPNVFFEEVIQFDKIPRGADGKVMRTLRESDLKKFKCHAGVKSPTQGKFGWWPDPEKKPGCTV